MEHLPPSRKKISEIYSIAYTFRQTYLLTYKIAARKLLLYLTLPIKNIPIWTVQHCAPQLIVLAPALLLPLTKWPISHLTPTRAKNHLEQCCCAKILFAAHVGHPGPA